MIPRRLFPAGLETSKQGLAAMRRAMATVIELEIVPDLNFLLPTILAIAKIATMVGLLGTVVSMIGTFNQLSKGGDMAAQSRSIGLALFATALGLVTAIPLVFAHVMFKAWIASFEIKMKSAAHKLVAPDASGETHAGAGAERRRATRRSRSADFVACGLASHGRRTLSRKRELNMATERLLDVWIVDLKKVYTERAVHGRHRLAPARPAAGS